MLFHYGITKIDQIELVTPEILEQMELTDTELQNVILEASRQAIQGNILMMNGENAAVAMG